MIIAIDGPAASGKSTTAREVARRLGFDYLDTGAMYRAVVWFLQHRGVDPEDPRVGRLLQEEFHFTVEPAQRYLVNGVDVSLEIRSPAVTAGLNRVTPLPEVRSFLVDLQRRLARGRNCVLDGRDIGTVVFPEAELKIFLVADLETRVERRLRELQAKGFPQDAEQVRQSLLERDHADRTRALGPLREAPDAVRLDTSNLTIDEQVEQILTLARDKMSAG